MTTDCPCRSVSAPRPAGKRRCARERPARPHRCTRIVHVQLHSRRCWLLLPAAAECLIELNESEEFVGLGLSKIEFGGEVVGFVGENFKVAGHSTFIANVGKACGVFGRGGEKILLFAKFQVFTISDQSVGNVAEGLLDGLLIGEESFLLLGLGKADTGANLSGGEDGLSERAGKAPETRSACEETRECIALEST